VRIVLVGAPGSGKGTQSRFLANDFDVPSLSSGGLLRELATGETQTGRGIAGDLNRGDLVPDDLVITSMRDAVGAAAPSGGYILEGFPRTVAQARRAESLLAPDAVIHLVVPDEVARARLARRAEGRADDAEQAVIDRRLRHFHDEIGPILQHYRDRGVLVTVDADRPPDAVHEAILQALANQGQENNNGDVQSREPGTHA
jgi:adenylate kinase